jgi:hypothetical protein
MRRQDPKTGTNDTARVADAGKPDDDKSTAPKPHTIYPTAVYAIATAGRVLGLSKSCLPREIRLRRLRVTKRAGKYFVLGKWLLEWLEAGELQRENNS